MYQALCLEELTATELCLRVAERLGVPPENMASLLRLTSTGILVHMDDTVSESSCHDDCVCDGVRV